MCEFVLCAYAECDHRAGAEWSDAIIAFLMLPNYVYLILFRAKWVGVTSACKCFEWTNVKSVITDWWLWYHDLWWYHKIVRNENGSSSRLRAFRNSHRGNVAPRPTHNQAQWHNSVDADAFQSNERDCRPLKQSKSCIGQWARARNFYFITVLSHWRQCHRGTKSPPFPVAVIHNSCETWTFES